MSSNQDLKSSLMPGEENSGNIQLIVIGQDTSDLQFLLKMTTPLGKLKKSYSEQVGIAVENLRFLFDGRRITDDDTPLLLEMENYDLIDVFLVQTGGYYY